MSFVLFIRKTHLLIIQKIQFMILKLLETIFGIQQWLTMDGIVTVVFSSITEQLRRGVVGQQEAQIFHQDLGSQWKCVMV